ncbi:MAG: hypothetical protein QGH33_01930 [Pirellulaceae bacterium]|nr:hypothetical protein [Pirellulaceae bacterium]MDP7305923.1 hypothetical protein [Pirellulaceae bacterium]HJN09508.1 hypothetical protein [Pirellulaceae bacterium]
MSSTDPTTPEHPYQPPSQPAPADPAGSGPTKRPPDIMRLAYAILWVTFVLIGGGALASYCALEFGELGMFVVWPIGWAGGFVASKILGGKSRFVGSLLVAACFGISVIAEVIWIHTEIEGADESWVKAISLLPAFIRQYRVSALIALIVSIFGAMSAWQQLSARYVRVRIDD